MAESEQELQLQLVHLNEQLIQTRGQITFTERRKRRAELVLEELTTLEETHNTYKAVGRMFIQAPLPSIKQEISDKIGEIEGDKARLVEKSKSLESRVVQLSDDLREMIRK